ncbi:MAG: T9SS type A sorting domain-containing protein, partial [Flavobacteriales bacterium]
ETDVLVFHGATDAPTVDVAETAVLGGATLVDDISYGEFAGYLEVPTADYVLQVRLADGTPVVSFDAPLGTLGLNGQAITVFASGFLDPSSNSNGASFGLWASLATGGPLVPLSIATSVTEISKVADQISLYPNPANSTAQLEIQGAKSQRMSVQVADVAGRMVMDLGTFESNNTGNSLQINVNSLAPGSYRLLINTKDAATSLPLQVVR